MPISSVGATSPAQALYQPEAVEKHTQAGRDTRSDGDSDDRGGNAVQPTVNTQGQVIGQLVNTKA
jgi:hypothetical protein